MTGYLDNASTAPLRPAARAAMSEYLSESGLGLGADPSRLYSAALDSRAVLEDARDRVASVLGVPARSVVFTSGGTESNLTAVHFGRLRGAHTVVTAVEHSSILDAVAGRDAAVLGVDAQGRIDLDELGLALRKDTGMVHCQWVNHETGVSQPVDQVVGLARAHGVLTHIDAAQAVGNLGTSIAEVDADLVSMSSHKVGGPVGVGVTLVRRGLRLSPWMLGGAQERARRGGLENLLGVLGFAAALEESDRDQEDRLARYGSFHAQVIAGAAQMAGVDVVGSTGDHSPHIVCLTVAGVEPQGVLVGLDRGGIAVHSGSACAAEDLEPSPVLAAMGLDAQHSLRISFGWATTQSDVDRLLERMPRVVGELRALQPG